MELEQYFHVFRRWVWLVVLAALITGGIGFAVRNSLPPAFRARSLISVGNAMSSANPNATDLTIAVSLAQTYARLAKTSKVLKATIDALNLNMSVGSLNRNFEVQLIPQTSLLILDVTDTNAARASALANEIAKQLILNSPTNLTPEQEEQLRDSTAQIAALNDEISEARSRLADLDAKLKVTEDPDEINNLTSQRNLNISQINQATANVAQFTTVVQRLQERSNKLEIYEPAEIPESPEDNGASRTALLGAALGAALGGSVIFVIAYLDKNVNSRSDIGKRLGLPLLATIGRFGRARDTSSERLITHQPVQPGITESYRSLHMKLLLSRTGSNSHKDVLLVTSPAPKEGKSITTANLAAVTALMGTRTLLVDADLRHPSVHQIFGLPNEHGFTTLLNASASLKNLPENTHLYYALGNITSEPGQPDLLSRCVQKTDIPNLSVITSGPVTENSPKLLTSTFLPQWLQIFKAHLDIDLVIFDTPPCLLVADTFILAAATKASVVLVSEADRTPMEAVARVKEQFTQFGVTVEGVVLNKVDPRETNFGYGYGYYYRASPDDTTVRREDAQRK